MHMLIFGHGYTAAALTRRLIGTGWTVSGTTRSAPERVAESGATPLLWPGDEDAIRAEIARADAILIGIAPRAEPPSEGNPQDAQDSADPPPSDRVLAAFGPELRDAPAKWIGYLSSTNVYGDHGGAWVDETTPPQPTSPRAHARVAAEAEWSRFAAASGHTLSIFRLAGIYGPGRGPFAKLRNGRARRIIKPGQVFSRIHVDDISGAIHADLSRVLTAHETIDERSTRSISGRWGFATRDRDMPTASRPTGQQPRDLVQIFNLCDNQPAPPEDVIARAAQLIGATLPPAEDFATAEMTPMARSFYADCKRVRNERLSEVLGYELAYPDYESGLRAILDAETRQGTGNREPDDTQKTRS